MATQGWVEGTSTAPGHNGGGWAAPDWDREMSASQGYGGGKSAGFRSFFFVCLFYAKLTFAKHVFRRSLLKALSTDRDPGIPK